MLPEPLNSFRSADTDFKIRLRPCSDLCLLRDIAGNDRPYVTRLGHRTARPSFSGRFVYIHPSSGSGRHIENSQNHHTVYIASQGSQSSTYLFSQHVSRIDFRKGSLIQLAHAHRVGCGGERQVSSSSSEASARSRAPAEYSYTFSTAIIIPAQRMLQPLPCFKPNSSDRRQRMPCRC